MVAFVNGRSTSTGGRHGSASGEDILSANKQSYSIEAYKDLDARQMGNKDCDIKCVKNSLRHQLRSSAATKGAEEEESFFWESVCASREAWVVRRTCAEQCCLGE